VIRSLLAVLPAILVFALCASATFADEEGFESLFNGKDLTGWEGNPELWSVEEGVITGRTKGPDHLKHNEFLIWKGTVKDFELKLEFRLEGNNNSGVQYRSKKLPEVGEWSVGGYQADIHPNPNYNGMLYDERGRGILAQRGEKVVIDKEGNKHVEKLDVPVEQSDLSEWHEMTIIARGNELKHTINGETTVEVTDNHEAQRDFEGIIGFQVHRGPAMTVQFRNIRIKHLNEGTGVREQESADESPGQAAKDDSNNGKPRWIWLHDEQGNVADEVYFRKEFRVRGEINAARLYATCDNRMTVYLNGRKVLESSEWSRPVFADVTRLIQEETPGGRHVLTVEGANSGGPAGLLVQLNVDSGWRKDWSFVSGESWQAGLKPYRGWRDLGREPPDHWKQAEIVGELGDQPWNITEEKLLAAAPLKEPEATPIDQLKLPEDFQAELLYSVPKEEQGSWVSMCVDPKGRLIVSDQYGGLFRVTPPGILDAEEVQVEKINVEIGEAQGLLWAFDSLYVVVNKGGKYESGLYRVRDTTGDDQLDSLETLRLLPGSGGEHGPHAVRLSPDGKSLYIVCGNKTNLTEFVRSRVPEIWDEDILLPRPYGRGFMKGVPAPGGYVAQVDPDGKEWELITVGFRNQYDAVFNADGELITFDADMEWDMNTPWYRPTRICHVLSGVDYGWRNGGAKWPEHYPDTLPPIVNIGPGSPTGVAFGYGARFPAKYQQAYYACDWSYGKLFAVHLEPQGASYTATFEEFLTGTPLPLTGIVVNPHDGAMYFAIGGRRVQSGLYRVTYTGSESTEPADLRNEAGADDRALRRKLEALHVGDHPDAVETAWPYLGHADRVIRYAARTALEHRPASEWADRALKEPDPQARLEALLALVRVQERETRNPNEAFDPPPPDWSQPSPGPAGDRGLLQVAMLQSLAELDEEQLTYPQKLSALRVVQLTLLRLGQPSTEVRQDMLEYFENHQPGGQELNAMALEILVYLQSPRAAELGIALLESAPSQEEQISYVKALRHQRAGWTRELRETFFNWFAKAAGYRGGASFALFVSNMKEEALAHLDEEEQLALKPILEKKPEGEATPFADESRPFVKEWTLQDLLPLVEGGLRHRDYDRGRQMFGAAKCFACHRFNGEGGAVGPDLTGLAGRFDARYILEAILEPSKVISDQYQAVQILTTDGKVIIGRIVNLAGDNISINTDMLNPDAQVRVDRKQIEQMVPSKVSMMPTGLINTLHEEEILDLMAFLMSRGDRNHEMFDKPDKASVQQSDP
jgi:putative heme-binding domain-containing protein